MIQWKPPNSYKAPARFWFLPKKIKFLNLKEQLEKQGPLSQQQSECPFKPCSQNGSKEPFP